MAGGLRPCATGCGAMTLHDDRVCQGCAGKIASHRNSDEAIEEAAHRMAVALDSGRRINAVDRNRDRLRRGFAMMDGFTA